MAIGLNYSWAHTHDDDDAAAAAQHGNLTPATV